MEMGEHSSRFPIDVVTGVILGAKCSDECVSAVLEMVKSLNIKCFRADLSKHDYIIHFADLNATNA